MDAAISAGTQRFRAIILTSLTTFMGLMPIVFERSLQAQVVIPMAISLAFGILFATVITLILIPSLYAILEQLKYRLIRTDGYQRKGGPGAPSVFSDDEEIVVNK